MPFLNKKTTRICTFVFWLTQRLQMHIVSRLPVHPKTEIEPYHDDFAYDFACFLSIRCKLVQLLNFDVTQAHQRVKGVWILY